MKQIASFLLLVLSTYGYAGEYFQADIYTEKSNTIVGTIERNSISLSGAHIEWDGGSQTGASVGYIINGDLKTIIGPSIMYIDNNTKYGVKLSVEDFNMYGDQSVYWQASINTIEKNWYVVLQYSPVYRHSFEAVIGGTDTDNYHYQTVAYSYRLTNTVNLRVGYRINDSAAFVGLSINTF
jgi:hypothetical protein